MKKDPYNVIITGVGGQGNVTMSRILGDMLVPEYVVTIGETFGASQRGGSVMSHIRVSHDVASPLIPRGRADLVVALEPIEAVRVLKVYGNRDTFVIVNVRPVYPVDVITGRAEYPLLETIEKTVSDFTTHAWFLRATDAAMELGSPLLLNSIMLGAVAGLSVLPLDKKDFLRAISKKFPEEEVKTNLKAFEMGIEMIGELLGR